MLRGKQTLNSDLYIIFFGIAMKCPVHSHYELCPNGNPLSCMSLLNPIYCGTFLCKEGCSCDDGYILSGEACVPLSKCGCLYGDKYYRIGQVFYPSGLCQEQCNCKEEGEVMDTQLEISAMRMYLMNIYLAILIIFLGCMQAVQMWTK